LGRSLWFSPHAFSKASNALVSQVVGVANSNEMIHFRFPLWLCLCGCECECECGSLPLDTFFPVWLCGCTCNRVLGGLASLAFSWPRW